MAQNSKSAAPRTRVQSPTYPTLSAMTIAATLCACGGQESSKPVYAASGGTSPSQSDPSAVGASLGGYSYSMGTGAYVSGGATGSVKQTATGGFSYSMGTGGSVAYVSGGATGSVKQTATGGFSYSMGTGGGVAYVSGGTTGTATHTGTGGSTGTGVGTADTAGTTSAPGTGGETI